MKNEDKMILATLAVPPLSVAVSVLVWTTSISAALATPLIASVVAVFTALELRTARNLAWGLLAVQVTVMMIVLYGP